MTEKQIPGRKGLNSGLALAELLVLIVSIVLLISILVPALGSVKTQAKEEVKCQANLRQVGITILMYLQEEDFKMPNCHVINGSNDSNKHLWTTDGRESSPRLGPDDNSYWGTAYNKYVKDINIFRCPAMAEFSHILANDLLYGVYLHPSVDPNDVIQQSSFGLNGYTDQLNTNSVPNQAEVVICTDHVEPRNEQASEAGHGDMFCMGADTKNLSHYRPYSASDSRPDHYRGIFRHNIRTYEDFETGGRASVLWLDGRVTTIEETAGENVPNRYYDPRGTWLNISP